MRAVVAVTAVIAVVLTGPPAAAAPAPPAIPPDGTGITLISGDRLRVAPDGRSVTRVPGAGRDGVALIVRFAAGRLQVTPVDALPLLSTGRLDPRLFDVTGLIEAGHHARDDLPLIVQRDDPAALAPLLTAADAGQPRDLSAVDASALGVPRARLAPLWDALAGGRLSDAYRKIWLDGVARPDIDVSVPLVGAPAAWAAGFTGGGVPVGVLDTGIDADHPDLAGAVVESADFTGSGDGVDRDGHGTHVASVVAGTGAASGGRHRGVAPDVRLYSGKVCAAMRCAGSPGEISFQVFAVLGAKPDPVGTSAARAR